MKFLGGVAAQMSKALPEENFAALQSFERHFETTHPNQAWVTYVTYIPRPLD